VDAVQRHLADGSAEGGQDRLLGHEALPDAAIVLNVIGNG
jgi:hypothetical protein